MRYRCIPRKVRTVADAGGRRSFWQIEPLECRTLLSHHVVNFDDLPANTRVTTQYPGVEFSSLNDFANWTDTTPHRNPSAGGGSDPNYLGQGMLDAFHGHLYYTDELYLDFTRPVNNLRFLALFPDEKDSDPVTAQVRVVTGATSHFTQIGPSPGTSDATPIIADLSAFKGVTRIEIFSVKPFGLRYDDFEFDDAPAVIQGQVVDADGNFLHGVEVNDVTLGKKEYTDYPSGSTTLSSSIRGFFRIDGVDPSRDTELTAFAESLGGSGQAVDLIVHPSQFHDGVADLGVIKIAAFELIDRNGNISLLSDERNDANSDVIRRRGSSGADAAVADSPRYRAEVTAVTQRLASLGFRQTNGTGNGEDAPPLTVTDTWPGPSAPLVNPPAPERALLLFQSLWFHGGSTGFAFDNAVTLGGRTVVSGQVDGPTASALSVAGVAWAMNDDTAKRKYPNIFTYQTPATGSRWMNASAIRFLSDLSPSLTAAGITALHINSASPATGLREPGGGHAAGSEVDMTWVTHDGTFGQGNFYRPLTGLTEVSVPKGANGEPLKVVGGQQKEWTIDDAVKLKLDTPAKAIAAGRTWSVQDTYDRAKTSTLIKKILAFPSSRVYQVIFNDPDLHDPADPLFVGGDRRFVFQTGHNNHVHVGTGFNHDALDAGTSGAPPWPPPSNSAPMFPNRSITTPINEGGKAVLRGTIFDPNPRDLFFLQVNWGDGTSEKTYRFEPTDPRQVEIRHRYRDNGDYTVSMLWHDQLGAHNTGTLAVHVNNVAPVVYAGGNASVGSSGWLNRTGSFDDPGTDTWKGTVDYGDGTGLHSLDLGPHGSFTLRHKYHRRGRFVVTVRIADDDGGVGTSNFTVRA